jgi:SPASM domain peptide maturase of grasp-with-spasm system
MSSHFKLFSNCFLIEGAAECIILDVHKKRYLAVSSQIASLLKNELCKSSITEVKAMYPNWQRGLDAYLEHFVENDYGFFTEEPHKFPPIDTHFERPGVINAALIEVDDTKLSDYTQVIEKLIKLGCKHFQLVFTDKSYELNSLQQLLTIFNDSIVRSVELLFQKAYFTQEEFSSFSTDLRVNSVVYGQPEEKTVYLNESEDKKYAQATVHYLERNLNPYQKEKYGKAYFNTTLNYYLESQHANPGLNQKVCIDKEGNIKNYLSHKQTFGSVWENEVAELIQSKGFQKKWHITNDEIEKCRECLFRYICFSNSDIEEREGRWFKTDDCEFNPLKNEWLPSK